MLASAAFFSVMIFSVRGWKSPKRAIPGVPETHYFRNRERAPLHAALADDARADPAQPRLQCLCERAVGALARHRTRPARTRRRRLRDAVGVLRHRRDYRRAADSARAAPDLAQHAWWWRASSFGWWRRLLIAWTSYTALALVGACGCGAAWVGCFASLSAGTQSAAPAWVRARAVWMNIISSQAGHGGRGRVLGIARVGVRNANRARSLGWRHAGAAWR